MDAPLQNLVRELLESSVNPSVTESYLWDAVRKAIIPRLLVSGLAERLLITRKATEDWLKANGFGYLTPDEELTTIDEGEDHKICADHNLVLPFGELFSVEFSPSLHQPIRLASSLSQAVSRKVQKLVDSADGDPFVVLYRKGVREYYDSFLASDARKINSRLADWFGGGNPRYVVTTGMGADEQFCHFAAYLNNSDPNRVSQWLIVDSPRHLQKLPSDATVENTLFMELSRSGKTEETVKIHEYTPRDAKRIVFANSGPLRAIGERDDNLVLDLPPQVSGRFGRNTTPILLAPMYVAHMDTNRFLAATEMAIRAFDLSSSKCLPVLLAHFIFLFQQKNYINHIYFGCNDDVLAFSADEFLQFWNEGVNKEGLDGVNDIIMSRHLGLLRDSHATVEGILANHQNKMGLFLLRDLTHPAKLPPMTREEIDPINPDHAGLCFGDEEMILVEANYQRFSDLMPTVKILVRGELTIEHMAVLGQLWADTTFCYSNMKNIDPGSNPEVKAVRDRAVQLLAESAAKLRESR